MEAEIIDSLRDLKYKIKEKEVDVNSLEIILTNWVEYSNIVAWCSEELCRLAKFEETVNPIAKISDENLNGFQMELGSLLKELGCPWNQIMEGKLAQRFEAKESRLLLLNYLVGEVQASRINFVINPKQIKVELSESDTSRCLREICQILKMGKPPDSITIKDLFLKMNENINLLEKKYGGKSKIIDKPLFDGFLSQDQWNQLEIINNQLNSEYKMRREMILKRLDVTIESFHWTDRVKSKKGEMDKVFNEKRTRMNPYPKVSLSHILSARAELAILEKTSNASVRKNTRSSVNTVKIGRVPDRGGRTNEIQPPPPEMPAWAQRQGPPAAAGSVGWSRGGRGGGGRGGGGRGDHQQHHDNRAQSGGGYQQNQGHHQQQQQASYNQNQGYHQQQQVQQPLYTQGYQQQSGYNQQSDYQDQYQGGGGGDRIDRNYQGGGRGSRVQGGWSSAGGGHQKQYDNRGGGGRGGYNNRRN